MSRADINIKETGGRNSVPVDRIQTNSGALTLIKAGELAKISVAISNANHAILCVDADFTIGTDKNLLGVAAADSTDTVAATGYVDIYFPCSDVKYEIKAKTAANADTQAEIDAFFGWAYLLDVTSSDMTLDMAGATAAANAFVVVGGDPNRSTVWFRIRPDATPYGRDAV